ncbi:MAG: PEP-CTERM sorting domain-containing protein [Verrucomicrobia bacterium]|nr:PEP-CTERM sorting domain-containing protein [Verrucomicrobiota bacterium]
MKKLFLVATAVLAFGATLRAESIDWSALGSTTPLHLNAGAAVPAGSLAYVGQFPAGFNFSANTTLNSLLQNFTILDQVFVGQDEAGGGSVPAGSFYGQISGNPIAGTNGFSGAGAAAVVGQPLFVWVFNASTSAAATQWGIVSNPGWTFASGAVATNVLDISDSGTFVPSGALGALQFNAGDNANELFLGNATVIPEPSTYALGLAGAATLMFFRRRRK